jgi:hypothetical protein
LRGVLKRLNAPFTLEVIEGGDHSFHVPAKLGVSPGEVLSHMASKTISWLSDWN